MKSVKQILRALESSGDYVFHGSGHEIAKFDVRQAFVTVKGERVSDGAPAIYASSSIDYAWFMAIVNAVNCPDGFHTYAGSCDGDLIFRATQHALDQLGPESKGYVYVFDKYEFMQRYEYEYYSLVARSAIQRFEVKFDDFHSPIESMR